MRDLAELRREDEEDEERRAVPRSRASLASQPRRAAREEADGDAGAVSSADGAFDASLEGVHFRAKRRRATMGEDQSRPRPPRGDALAAARSLGRSRVAPR